MHVGLPAPPSAGGALLLQFTGCQHMCVPRSASAAARSRRPPACPQVTRAEAKDIVFDQESRRKMQDGINKVADAVSVTLGPRGESASPPGCGCGCCCDAAHHPAEPVMPARPLRLTPTLTPPHTIRTHHTRTQAATWCWSRPTACRR